MARARAHLAHGRAGRSKPSRTRTRTASRAANEIEALLIDPALVAVREPARLAALPPAGGQRLERRLGPGPPTSIAPKSR